MAKTKSYRHSGTGIVREYPESIARRHPELVEVEPGTKPLAYTRIPQSAIDEHEAGKTVTKPADQDAPAVDSKKD